MVPLVRPLHEIGHRDGSAVSAVRAVEGRHPRRTSWRWHRLGEPGLSAAQCRAGYRWNRAPGSRSAGPEPIRHLYEPANACDTQDPTFAKYFRRNNHTEQHAATIRTAASPHLAEGLPDGCMDCA